MRGAAVAIVVMWAALCGLATPVMAAPSVPAPAPAQAWILVDGDTGAVLDAGNERAALAPASITKLLTALTVLARKDPQDSITVDSPLPETMPALKVGVRQGETWTVDRLLHGLLMVSANDAAVALAIGTSGSLDAFVDARNETARQLGLQDQPAFNDPAGLDDSEWSHNGGDRVSARDMAIIGRAALANPEIRTIVATQRFDFVGLDNQPHHFLNHNGLLKTYPGAIGLKTGYTKKAGRTLVAAAQRDGRTMIAVVMNAPSPSVTAAALMDKGFATPRTDQPTGDVLPLTSVVPIADAAPPLAAVTVPSGSHALRDTAAVLAIAVLLGGLFLGLRRHGPSTSVRWRLRRPVSVAPPE